MPVYFLQNKEGEFLTDDRLWTSNETRASRFSDVRGLLKACDSEHLYDAVMVVDFCDPKLTRITIPVRHIASPPSAMLASGNGKARA